MFDVFDTDELNRKISEIVQEVRSRIFLDFFFNLNGNS